MNTSVPNYSLPLTMLLCSGLRLVFLSVMDSCNPAKRFCSFKIGSSNFMEYWVPGTVQFVDTETIISRC